MNLLKIPGVIFLLIYLSLAITWPASTQNFTQTVKGKVYDSESHISLPGATVIVAGTDPLIGTTASSRARLTDHHFAVHKL